MKTNKKYIKILSYMLVLISFISCSQKPEDIPVSDLKTGCDYVHAIEKCSDAIIDIVSNKKWGDLKHEDKEYVKILRNKIKELDKSMNKTIVDEFKNCPSYERLKIKVIEYNLLK